MNKLWPALTAGFLLSVNDEYCEQLDQDPTALDTAHFDFRHDRIREVRPRGCLT